jgi:hypothetical protein
MKKSLIVAAVLIFCFPSVSLAQSTAGQTPTHLQASAPQSSSPKIITLSGKVSADAKWIAVSRQTNLTVQNPLLLAGHEGRIVTVKCEKDPATGAIRIVAVKSSRDESNTVAKLDDSAFRK